MAQSYYCGTGGDFIFGGTNLLVEKWEFKSSRTVTDVVAKGDGGFSFPLACARKGEISAEGYFDADVHEGDPPPAYDGATGAFELEMEEGGTSVSGNCIITELTITHEHGGVAKFKLTAQTRGTYYLPGEATS